MAIDSHEVLTRPDPRGWPAVTGRFGVTGSRNFPWAQGWMIRDSIRMVYSHFQLKGLEPVLVEGGCPTGADYLARRIWNEWHRKPETWNADWDSCGPECPSKPHRVVRRPTDRVHPGTLDTYCPKAGPRRNKEMARSGLDILLAFPEPGLPRGRGGTWNCVSRAEEAGVEVLFPMSWEWDYRRTHR